MANYWSEFSIAFKLPSKEAHNYALSLYEKLKDEAGKEREDWSEFGEQFEPEFRCDFECEDNDNNALWIWQANGESGGVDDAITFIQHLLKKFDPEAVVTIEWSNCCGKPRIDAFGGGAAIIMAEEVRWMNTKQWIGEQTNALKNKQIRSES